MYKNHGVNNINGGPVILKYHVWRDSKLLMEHIFNVFFIIYGAFNLHSKIKTFYFNPCIGSVDFKMIKHNALL